MNKPSILKRMLSYIGGPVLVGKDDNYVISFCVDRKTKTGTLEITYRKEMCTTRYPLQVATVLNMKTIMEEAFMEYCDDHAEIKPCDECGKIDKDLNDIMNQPVGTQDIYPSGPILESDEDYLKSKFNKLYPNLDINDVDGHRAWRVFQVAWKAREEEGFPTPPTLQPMTNQEYLKLARYNQLTERQTGEIGRTLMQAGLVVKTKEDEALERFAIYHKDVQDGLVKSLKNGCGFVVSKISKPVNLYAPQWTVSIDYKDDRVEGDYTAATVWDKEVAITIANSLNDEADKNYPSKLGSRNLKIYE